MSNIRTENWNSHKIRFVENNGEWWAVAKDVADALGYQLTTNMTRILDSKDKDIHKVNTLGGYNIYGATNDSEILLGTYDEEEDAESIVQEIFMLMSNGKVQYFKMPEPSLGLEELEG